ncbi:hypothetical protein RSP03_06950 [Cereibacter sphaeroides]|nr:hypothetical protein RSP03_06950 [Cereibacter sphaeroides]
MDTQLAQAVPVRHGIDVVLGEDVGLDLDQPLLAHPRHAHPGRPEAMVMRVARARSPVRMMPGMAVGKARMMRMPVRAMGMAMPRLEGHIAAAAAHRAHH